MNLQWRTIGYDYNDKDIGSESFWLAKKKPYYFMIVQHFNFYDDKRYHLFVKPVPDEEGE